MGVRLGSVKSVVKRGNVRHWGKPFSTDGYAVRLASWYPYQSRVIPYESNTPSFETSARFSACACAMSMLSKGSL